MKKLLVLIVLFAAGCSSSETIELKKLNLRDGVYYKVNSDTPYTGRFVEHYENGNKRMEGYLKNGKQNGFTVVWEENGQKTSESNWKQGKREGLTVLYRPNGQKYEESNYKNGKPDGPVRRWDENGKEIK